MNNFLDKLEGILNPIFFNDFKKKIKSYSFWVNVIFLFIVYLIIFIKLLNKYYFDIFDSVRSDYYILAFTFLTVFAVLPLEIRNITANEFKNNNIFFIFMSKINASQFIKGKFLFGIFYNVVLLIIIIPILIYIYHMKRLGLNILIRAFYYCCLIPLPVILINIYLGCILKKESALSRYASQMAAFAHLAIIGTLFALIGVSTILDEDPSKCRFSIADFTISNPLIIDVIISFVFLILTAAFFHGLYSYLISLYPMSAISNSIEPKPLSSFSFKLKYIQPDNSINTNKLSNTSEESKYINNTVISNHKINNETINQIDSNQIKESSSQEESALKTNKLEELGVKIKSKKKRLSEETIIKMLFSFASIIFLFIIALKKDVAYVYMFLFFFLFPILTIYFLTRNEKYDKQSKSQIPVSGFKKVIFFPFGKGFVNGFVWLLMSSILFLLILYFAFGPHIVPPGTHDIKHPFMGGYYVFMAFMLNTMSWCFLCRFISDLFLNNPKDSEPKSEKAIYLIIAIIFISLSIQSKLPVNPKSLNLISYLIPTMLFYLNSFFFKGHLAFIFNLIFFIITLILHLKTMKNQLSSYINNES